MEEKLPSRGKSHDRLFDLKQFAFYIFASKISIIITLLFTITRE